MQYYLEVLCVLLKTVKQIDRWQSTSVAHHRFTNDIPVPSTGTRPYVHKLKTERPGLRKYSSFSFITSIHKKKPQK